MSELADRTIMTLIVATAVLGLIGYAVTILVYRAPEGLLWYAFPVLMVVVILVVLAATWEGLDVMD